MDLFSSLARFFFFSGSCTGRFILLLLLLVVVESVFIYLLYVCNVFVISSYRGTLSTSSYMRFCTGTVTFVSLIE